MKKKALFAFIVLFYSSIAISQISFIAHDYQLKFSSESYKRNFESIVSVSEDYIYTSNGFKSYSAYDKKTLNRIWSKKLELKVKHDGKKLLLSKSFQIEDKWVFIYSAYDKINQEKVFYHSSETDKNTPAKYVEFLRVPLQDENQFHYKFHFAADEIILLCLTDFNIKNNGKMYAIWLDKQLEETHHMEQQTLPKSEIIHSVAYNATSKTIYATVRSSMRSINGKPLEMTHAFYSFSMQENTANKTQLLFDDFRIFSANVNLLPKTKTPFLVTLVGDKKTNSVTATGYFVMHKTDAFIEAQSFYNISNDVVTKVVESKTKMEKFFVDAKEVNLEFDTCIFMPNGSFYTVFEDRGYSDVGAYNRGQYVTLIDKYMELEWQDFSIVFGHGQAVVTLKNDNLEIYQIISTKYISKFYPIKEVPDPGIYDYSIMKSTISPEENKVSHLVHYNAKENRQYRMVFEYTKSSLDQNTIYLNGFGFTMNCKLAEFIIP